MLLVSNESGIIANLDSNSFGYLALGAALLIFLGGGLLSRYRGQAGPMLRDAVTWAALGLALVALYSYRDALMPFAGRLAGELIPGSAMTVEESPNGPVEVKIRRRLDGHFTAKVEVNGKTISMIVDTGASTIVLRPEDAAKAGIDDGKKRAVGFKLSDGMEVPEELAERFKFARQKSKLAGTIRGSYFVIKGEY